MESINLLTGSSIIISGIGLILVIRIWTMWRHQDKDVLKAKVFLDKTFLVRNWMFVFLAGTFITLHQLAQFMYIEYFRNSNILLIVSEFLTLVSILALLVLAYEWYSLLRPKELK